MKKKLLCLSAKHINRFYIYLSIPALLSGGIIYILFRTSEPVFFNWIRWFGLNRWLDFARLKFHSSNLDIPAWIIFSLPDGLWSFGYALIITGIWWGTESWLRYFWMASIPLLVIGYEVFQYAEIIPGTFCMQDIGMGLAGLTAGIIAGIKSANLKNHEESTQ